MSTNALVVVAFPLPTSRCSSSTFARILSLKANCLMEVSATLFDSKHMDRERHGGRRVEVLAHSRIPFSALCAKPFPLLRNPLVRLSLSRPSGLSERERLHRIVTMKIMRV